MTRRGIKNVSWDFPGGTVDKNSFLSEFTFSVELGNTGKTQVSMDMGLLKRSCKVKWSQAARLSDVKLGSATCQLCDIGQLCLTPVSWFS